MSPPQQGNSHTTVCEEQHHRLCAWHVACCGFVSPGIVAPTLGPPRLRGALRHLEMPMDRFDIPTLDSRGTTQTTAIVDPSRNDSPLPHSESRSTRSPLLLAFHHCAFVSRTWTLNYMEVFTWPRGERRSVGGVCWVSGPGHCVARVPGLV